MVIHVRDPRSQRTDVMTRQLQSANGSRQCPRSIFWQGGWKSGEVVSTTSQRAKELSEGDKNQSSPYHLLCYLWSVSLLECFTVNDASATIWQLHRAQTVDSIALELRTQLNHCRRLMLWVLSWNRLMLLPLIFQPFVRQHSVDHIDEHNTVTQFWRGRELKISKIIRGNINMMSIFKRFK